MTASRSSKWNGSNPPKERSDCPYTVEYTAKPIPSDTLHSMEAGKLQLNVFLKGLSSSETKVEGVIASMINQVKQQQQILDKLEDTTEPKHTTSITINLQHGKSNNNHNINWSGEFSIPSTWVEGGTKTFQRSGSYYPSEEKYVYLLEITYKLTDGKTCTAEFHSTDAFHW